jgi:fibro-slime domain-containing protein
MFMRASTWLVLGALIGLTGAVAGCATAHNGTGSVFEEDSGGGGQTAGNDATTPPESDSGPPISIVMDASTQDATVDGGCVGDACAEASAQAICGDGVIEAGEECDDGNAASGDGCSSTCQIETGYTCPVVNQPCVPVNLCGNGVLDGAEQCDDGNRNSGDGCSSSCQIEMGWQCPVPGSECTPICGDGIVVGREQCDVGPVASSDAGATEAGAADGGAATGCSANCTIEPGYACTPPPGPSVCHVTVCGDGIKEGSEQCDDGNLVPYDGCSPTCTIEPKCNGAGGCTGVCGDGLVFPGEQCDDGNTVSGDGCSSTCTIEPGFVCTNVAQPPAATLAIPILYRDMLYFDTTSFPTPAPVGGGHPDFNRANPGVVTGLVQTTLGTDGEPLWASNFGVPPATMNTLSSPSNFCWWYHDTGCTPSDGGATTAGPGGADAGGATNPYAKRVFLDALGRPTTLTLTQSASGTYNYAQPLFFPLDGLGWNAGTNPQTATDCEPDPNDTDGGFLLPGVLHNFSFTSELHYIFTFQESVAASTTPSVFSFTGDDSVWAFINNTLVVDLGGVHNPASGSFTLTPANAQALGLVDGGWYSIDVFQAEQHVCRSTYNLTLSNFTHVISECQSVCGDGIVSGNEQCDTGANNVPPSIAYGKGVCTTNCTLAPYCGDAVVNTAFGETCDDGSNLATYGDDNPHVCGPGCRFAPYCGDGLTNGPEACDNGPNNVPPATAYGVNVCTTSCTKAPYCGDGIVEAQFGEVCDGTANCNSSCMPTGAM